MDVGGWNFGNISVVETDDKWIFGWIDWFLNDCSRDYDERVGSRGDEDCLIFVKRSRAVKDGVHAGFECECEGAVIRYTEGWTSDGIHVKSVFVAVDEGCLSGWMVI